MANRYAISSGNWSNPAIWDGGTLPTSVDDVRANGFTIQIDISVNVLSIRTSAQAPAVAGGAFYISNGVTLTADVYSGSNTFGGLQFNLISGQSATIIGNIYAGANAGSGITVSNTGTLNVFGSIFGNSNTVGIITTIGAAGGIINVTGIAGGFTANAININTASTLNFTGTVMGGTNATVGIIAGSGAIINVNGSITGQFAAAIISSSACTVNAVGVITAGAAPAIELTLASAILTASGTFVNNGGVAAFFSRRVFIGPNPTTWSFIGGDFTTPRLMYTADVSPGMPAIINVKDGVVYGQSSELTGTLKVPPASAVAVGVPVDGTVGTAMLSAQDLFDEIASSSDIIAQRLRNVATVDTTAATIAAYNT